MIKKLTPKQYLIILASLGIFLVAVIALAVITFTTLHKEKKNTAHYLEQLWEQNVAIQIEINGLKQELDFIAQETQTSASGLLALREETASQINEVTTTTQSSLGSAQDNLRQEIIQNNQENQDHVADLINAWGGVVGLVSCSDEESGSSRGSGTLFMLGSVVSITTNWHVVTDDNDIFMDSCEISFPEGDIPDIAFIPSETVASESDSDLAIIRITSPSAQAITQAKKVAATCDQKPEIGASIIVLGYPSIGARAGLTVTEGIISGYDGDYFISSAKVDKGNSGGAAIWVEESCFVGIPTKVYAGAAETLARILDITAFEL